MKTLVVLLCALCSCASVLAKPMTTKPPLSPPAAALRGSHGVFRMVEIRFELPNLTGNPFDYLENDIRLAIRCPNAKTVQAPAFYDGGTMWRVRFTPAQSGKHSILRVLRNGKSIESEGLRPLSFNASGVPKPGFVRRDRTNPRRFVLDNGQVYYPIGNNVAWDTDRVTATVEMMLLKMGKAGENWSRIWMNHWDGKNLDWVEHKAIPLGQLDLGVARRWDSVVSTAEKSGIRFQMVLQHHGQYASGTDSNWLENPWNAANGGFLSRPEEFFTSPRAISLTKAKYRYIIARWGCSPSVMAWELFNEVHWTDAVKNGNQASVANWHNTMVDFIRAQDINHHLITSSFSMDPKVLGDRLDYWQPHEYASDPLAAVSKLNGLKTDRPVFLGEIGPGGSVRDGEDFLRPTLWGSIMSEADGAAQYWAWHILHGQNLYTMYPPAIRFVRWTNLTNRTGLKAREATLETDERGPLTFGPGGGWEAAGQTVFDVPASGAVPGLAKMPGYLQGSVHADLFQHATFKVNYNRPGTFSVRIGLVAKAGAKIRLLVDGAQKAEKDYPAGDKDREVSENITVPVPAGSHEIRLENTGRDWVILNNFTLDPYAHRMGVVGKGNREFAVFWLFVRGDSEVTGTLTVPGLKPGDYTVKWWDTSAGKPREEARFRVSTDGILRVKTPRVMKDIAVMISREAGK